MKDDTQPEDDRANRPKPASGTRRSDGNRRPPAAVAAGASGGPTPGPRVDPFAERRRLLRQVKGPRLGLALAMCDLDELTDPDALQKRDPQVAQDIRTLTRHLMFRVLHRGAWALQERPFQPSPAADEEHRAAAKRVEAQFRKAMLAAFKPPTKGLPFDVHKFERTFAAFVAGEIATFRLLPAGAIDTSNPAYCHGMPDGANTFAFAEAVLLFLRLRLHPEFWEPTLRTFVAGAAFFSANYWDRSARTRAAYSWRAFQPNASSDAILAMMAQFHGALHTPALARVFGDIVGVALRDEASRLTTVPLPPEFS